MENIVLEERVCREWRREKVWRKESRRIRENYGVSLREEKRSTWLLGKRRR